MGVEKLTIEDISHPRRPTLGNDVPVTVFRILRLIGMHRILGETAGYALYMAGKELGAKLEVSSVDELIKLLRDVKVGIASVTESSDDRVVIFLEECITCSGLPNIGEVVCHFEGGVIAGALERIFKRPAKAVQTKGQAAGYNGCEFEVRLF